MSEVESLQRIVALIAQDVAQKSSSQTAVEAFRAYRQCLEPLSRPYARNDFIDEPWAQARFLSETATLHLAVSLIPQWCAVHEVGHAEDFCRIHEEARFFSWYEVPSPLSLEIRDWVAAHSDISTVLQTVALAAENSLSGLRRRSLGEFFTPTEIARHMVALAEYDPLTISSHRVLDPACGSGNFLAAVVTSIVRAVQSGLLDPVEAISGMNDNIYGFDIQPIAVLLTRLQLLLASLPIVESAGSFDTNLFELLSFPRIELRDPLPDIESYWDLFAPFDLVLGNPPFLKVAKGYLTFPEKYRDILAGHINLYQLFLWWAVRATRPDGRVVFLVPQSIRSGQYSNKLRQEIATACDVTAITGFVDRTGVFDSVEQPMMVVSLRKHSARSQNATVDVRESSNGESVEHSSVLRVEKDQVTRVQGGTLIWCVSNEELDYQILAKVCREQATLGETEEFRVLNGGFVWNQHVERLGATESKGSIPLLSSASIGLSGLLFPPSDKRVSKRLFADATPPLPAPVYNSASVLVKRTTPQVMRGRRIVAAYLPSEFLKKYPGYFVENHANITLLKRGEQDEYQLAGLCAWLNSRLVNFLFGLVNVSSHLSLFDLSLIPLPTPLLRELADLLIIVPDGSIAERRQVQDRIDERAFRYFGLSPTESQRVLQVVPPVV